MQSIEEKINVLLRDHQKKALQQLNDGNILWGGVGSGKSRVALAYYLLTRDRDDQDVYVITTAKKRDSLDWHTEAVKFGVYREPSDYEVEHNHMLKTPDDEPKFGVLTVDSWNLIDKYANVEGQFFIFDEQRLVGKGKWTKAFLKIAKKNRWILLSATPGDTWMDFIPVFIANGFYKNRTEFINEHVIYRPFSKIPKVERYVNVQRLVRLKHQILVHMPYEYETVRHPITVWVEHDELIMARVSHGRWNIFEDSPIRDIADQLHLMRRVANTDPSRLKAVWDLLQKHDRLIIFYNFDYELAILRTLAESEGRPYAEWNGHRHDPIPETDQWIYVVQYVAGAESWNCITTNAECFYSLTYSYKLWEQAHGRIDRINTEYKDLYYYYLRSKAEIDWAIWRSLKSKKNFQTKHFDIPDEDFYEYLYQRGGD